jgi:hypothetical protein
VYGHLLLPLNRHDSRLQPLRQKVQTLGEVVLYLKTYQQNCGRSGPVACPEGMQHAFEPEGTYIPRRLFWVVSMVLLCFFEGLHRASTLVLAVLFVRRDALCCADSCGFCCHFGVNLSG